MIRTTLIASLALAILAAAVSTGCRDDKKTPAPSSSPKAVAQQRSATTVDYREIDKLVAVAKTSDDFLDIVMKCGELQIDAAMAGNDQLSKDPTYLEKCEIAPEKARAQRVVANSTPDSPSVMCITAAINLEDLIELGRAKDELATLLNEVNTACGI